MLKEAAEISRTASDSPRVYLQILDNNQREQANAISNRLKRSGFKVQGVELVRVPVAALKQTQVKYFRPEYADEAQGIVALLKQSGIQATTVSLNAAAGQIEIWFSTDAFPAPKEPSKSPQFNYGSLTGHMYDAETKTPIEGVTIVLQNQMLNGLNFKVATDSKGNFRIAKLPAFPVGMYDVKGSSSRLRRQRFLFSGLD